MWWSASAGRYDGCECCARGDSGDGEYVRTIGRVRAGKSRGGERQAHVASSARGAGSAIAGRRRRALSGRVRLRSGRCSSTRWRATEHEAVGLYERPGFDRGTVPEALDHPEQGLVGLTSCTAASREEASESEEGTDEAGDAQPPFTPPEGQPREIDTDRRRTREPVDERHFGRCRGHPFQGTPHDGHVAGETVSWRTEGSPDEGRWACVGEHDCTRFPPGGPTTLRTPAASTARTRRACISIAGGKAMVAGRETAPDMSVDGPPLRPRSIELRPAGAKAELVRALNVLADDASTVALVGAMRWIARGPLWLAVKACCIDGVCEPDLRVPFFLDVA